MDPQEGRFQLNAMGNRSQQDRRFCSTERVQKKIENHLSGIFFFRILHWAKNWKQQPKCRLPNIGIYFFAISPAAPSNRNVARLDYSLITLPHSWNFTYITTLLSLQYSPMYSYYFFIFLLIFFLIRKTINTRCKKCNVSGRF